MSIFNEAISVTGIGLVIVFLGLIILIVFVYILAGLFHDRHSGQKAPEAPAPAAAAAPAPEVKKPEVNKKTETGGEK